MPTLVIGPAEAGQTVATVLRSRLRASWAEARRLVRERRVRLADSLCLDPTRQVKPGQRLRVTVGRRTWPAGSKKKAADPKHVIQRKRQVESRANKASRVRVGSGKWRADSKKKPPPDSGQRSPATARYPWSPVVRFADAHVIVVEKPPGLTTMRHSKEAMEFGPRARRFLPQTLADLLPELLPADYRGRAPRIRAVHRLDRDTSGLVVFACTRAAERQVGLQFRGHTIERRYLAVVRGRAEPGRIESRLVRDRSDGRRGSTIEPGAGQRAVTHVRVLENLGDFTLVECCLETGRTHQVRIHLAEAGTPLCGERVYDRPLHGKPLPDPSGFSRPALHAATLGFVHPATGKRMLWHSKLPPDMAKLIARLRQRAR